MKENLYQKIKENWKSLSLLFIVIGIGWNLNDTMHTKYASADTIKQVLDVIQQTKEQNSLEIYKLRLEFVQKEIDDLEKKCSVNCSFDEKQELSKLKEKKEDLKGRMK